LTRHKQDEILATNQRFLLKEMFMTHVSDMPRDGSNEEKMIDLQMKVHEHSFHLHKGTMLFCYWKLVVEQLEETKRYTEEQIIAIRTK
jgi:hypothetical protein